MNDCEIQHNAGVELFTKPLIFHNSFLNCSFPVQKQRSEFKISPLKQFQKNINELYGSMMDCLEDIGVIIFGLKGHFWGQKELFKTILGRVLDLF
ncbi:MAG: hypothetical protein DRH24_12130 [Deltaproteobacteria bacterium]|nr:MAG: hypothetical protein DRH24_12130 [Deltaproteobacteria bacterium]